MERDGQRNYAELSEILRVLGHPQRLRIVAGLSAGECNVKTIWKALGLPQATVSQHLTVLKNKGILTSARSGTEVRYRISHPLAFSILNAVCREG